jgi:hypothetical protein
MLLFPFYTAFAPCLVDRRISDTNLASPPTHTHYSLSPEPCFCLAIGFPNDAHPAVTRMRMISDTMMRIASE